MKKSILLFFISLVNMLNAQESDTISLKYLLNRIDKHDPVNEQLPLNKTSYELLNQNLSRKFLPSLEINAQTTYQSDVTEINIDMPPGMPFSLDFPEIGKESYKISLDINQIIYEGGVIKANKEIAETEKLLKDQEVFLNKYEVKTRIQQLYFSVLILEKTREVLQTSVETIEASLKDVESAIENGLLLKSEGHKIQAEILKTEQDILETDARIQSGYSVLASLTNLKLTSHPVLRIPTPHINLQEINNERVELNIFETQQHKLDHLASAVDSKTKPVLLAFGQAGYGKPGLNMLSNTAEEFFVIGAKLNWSFYNWNLSKNEKEILRISQDVIDNNKQLFLRNLNIESRQKLTEINKLQKLLGTDSEILALHSNIRKISASQLKEGVITSNEYLKDVNAEKIAALNLEVHEIQLIRAKYDYLKIWGQL